MGSHRDMSAALRDMPATLLQLPGQRFQGVIKSFNPNKGYGFVSCPDLQALYGCDVFLSSLQINGFGLGDEVSFTIDLNKDNKPQAYNLQQIASNSPAQWQPRQSRRNAQVIKPPMTDIVLPTN